MVADVNTVATTYGAILIGTFFGCCLTGVVFVQCIIYFKVYPSDFLRVKLLVALVWSLDTLHTILITVAVWQSMVGNFNKPENMDIIPTSLGLSVAVTAGITFLVHCFFADRIRKLTKKWYLAAPIVFLASLRLLSACVSTAEIIRLKRYSEFIKPFPSWVFTLGVTLSASVEFIITITMIIFLKKSRTGFESMNHIINSLVLYTLETGGITCAVTIISLICWLNMRHNLIFLGLHFAIAKLYANSLLATLNTRKRLREDRSFSSHGDHAMPVLFPDTYNVNRSRFSKRMLGSQIATTRSLQINVEKTIIVDGELLETEGSCAGSTATTPV